ncbi:MAG: WD40 repeat domain-containing protein [Anaerolineae bacterium]|nr:WD40 repeat domain-containing protein [Anaerolineae bacterium]
MQFKFIPAITFFALMLFLSTLVAISPTSAQSLSGIISVEWSPDGQKIAGSGGNGFLRIWDANTGNTIRDFTGLSGTIYSVTWSPDSSKIASAGDDKIIRIWNAANGALLASLQGHNSRIISVSWSPDGSQIVSASFDEALNLRTWNTSTYTTIATLRAGDILSAKWKPDNSKIGVLNSNAGIFILDPALNVSYENLSDFRFGPQATVVGASTSMAWRPDGVVIAIGFYNGSIYLWNTNTNQQLALFQVHTNSVNSLSWSPDSTQLASSSIDGTIKIWDVSTGTILNSIQKGTGLTLATAWSPDSGEIAYGDNSAGAMLQIVPSIPPSGTARSHTCFLREGLMR